VAAQALPVSEALLSLLSDEVARVRAAGARALAEVGGIEHRAPLESLLVDPEIEVRRAAGASLTGLSARLGPSRP
jgi:HEAT repeat protein